MHSSVPSWAVLVEQVACSFAAEFLQWATSKICARAVAAGRREQIKFEPSVRCCAQPLLLVPRCGGGCKYQSISNPLVATWIANAAELFVIEGLCQTLRVHHVKGPQHVEVSPFSCFL